MTVTMNLCDRCCASSAVTVIMQSGSQLMFCQHHYNEYAEVIEEQGGSLISDAELAGEPDMSALAQ